MTRAWVAMSHVRCPPRVPRLAVERFRGEAGSGRPDYPHIPALHDFGTQDGILYAVFGCSKARPRKRLLDGPPHPQGAGLAVQICRGLHAAHSRHRAPRPEAENLFLARDGHLKISTSASPKCASRRPREPARRWHVDADERLLPSGTFGYMSPGSSVGNSRPGLRPLRGRGRAVRDGLRQAPFEERAPPRAWPCSPRSTGLVVVRPLPPALEPLVRRCRKEAPDRFQSAHDMAFALEAVLAGLRPPSRSGRAALRPARAWLVPPCPAAGGCRCPRRRSAGRRPRAARLHPTHPPGLNDVARFAPDRRTVITPRPGTAVRRESTPPAPTAASPNARPGLQRSFRSPRRAGSPSCWIPIGSWASSRGPWPRSPRRRALAGSPTCTRPTGRRMTTLPCVGRA